MKPNRTKRQSSFSGAQPAGKASPGSAVGRDLWWSDLLAQLYRECTIWETNADVAVSVPRAFLKNNQIEIGQDVDLRILNDLRLATEEAGGLSEAGFILPSAGADDAAYVARIRRLVLAHDALTAPSLGSEFQKLLAEANPPVDLEQLAEASGLVVARIRYALTAKNGCTGLEGKEVCRLDQALGAKGRFVALYAALSQHSGLQDQIPAMDRALGKDSFGAMLQRHRLALGLTLGEVCRALETADIHVSESQLNGWECGYNQPTRDMAETVSALDQFLRCEEMLVKAWDEKNRRIAPSPYAIRFSKLPTKVQAQLNELVKFKQLEYCDSPGPQDPGRWTEEASRERAVESVERIFGFLVNFCAFPVETLSLTLLAKFEFIISFFDFVKNRMGRIDYSYDAVTIASVLKNWYTYYFPRLLQDVGNEEYWAANLPKVAEGVDEVAPGVTRPYKYELKTVEARWRYQIHTATCQCKELLKSGKFSRSNLGRSAAPLFQSSGGLREMVAIRAVSGRVSCVDMALHMRRLTMAVTLIARCFRPETLLSLRVNQGVVQPDGRVWLDVPPEQYKQKGKGGSKLGFKGYLADFSYMHEIFRRYLQEARPILLGDPKARRYEDEGYLFTPFCDAGRMKGDNGSLPGGPLSHELLRRDIHMVLGYAAYAQRHVFSTEALLQDLISEEIAQVLANTSKMIDLHYDQGSPEFDMEIANRGIEMLFFGK
jgi:transcriptional regulator with XRE-family HTH domain